MVYVSIVVLLGLVAIIPFVTLLLARILITVEEYRLITLSILWILIFWFFGSVLILNIMDYTLWASLLLAFVDIIFAICAFMSIKETGIYIGWKGGMI